MNSTELLFTTTDGLKIKLSPSIDDRILKINRGRVIAKTFNDARSIARELKAFGLKAREDGSLVRFD